MKHYSEEQIREVGEDYASMYGHEMVGYKRLKDHIEVYTQGEGEGFIFELNEEDFE